ncbi:MAG: aldehyde dehydrogenase family protein, partial [Dehalococcoidia bacterium]
YLVESPQVDMVSFTGSKAVGTWIYETAAGVVPQKGGIKRVVAEMGGKNAIIVFPDADLDETVLGILQSAFSHAGQKCSACSRVLVHRQIYRRLAQRLVAAARSLPIGPADDPGTIINPVIDSTARERILSEGERASREGQVLLDTLQCEGDQEYCLGPLIMTVEPQQAREAYVTREEIFGPVLPLVPFDTEAEAVSLVNGTAYGLTLGIFSRSPGTISRMVRASRVGNIYVNREITGARVGIEPFGGLQLSGTGPKTGGEEYLQSFLTRRAGFRQGSPVETSTPNHVVPAYPLPSLSSWEAEPIARRLQRLSNALAQLDRCSSELNQVLDSPCAGVASNEGGEIDPAARIREVVAEVLGAVDEIALRQPTLEIPGQTNLVRWDTPRGIGLVAVDDGADPSILAALIFAALLAGNGVVALAWDRLYPVAGWLVDQLWQAGVPEEVLALAPANTPPATVAAGPVNFAAADLKIEATRTLYQVLGITNEEEGQRWLKALISMDEGIRPGEPGFLRQFALPKAVAVRTLRHGADLELV